MKKEKNQKQGTEKEKLPTIKKLSAKDLKKVYGGGRSGSQSPGCSNNPCCK